MCGRPRRGVLNAHGAIDGHRSAGSQDVSGQRRSATCRRKRRRTARAMRSRTSRTSRPGSGPRPGHPLLRRRPPTCVHVGDRVAPALLEIDGMEDRGRHQDRRDGHVRRRRRHHHVPRDLTGTEPDPVAGGVASSARERRQAEGRLEGLQPGHRCRSGRDGTRHIPRCLTATGSIMISAWADISHPLAGSRRRRWRFPSWAGSPRSTCRPSAMPVIAWRDDRHGLVLPN